MFQSSMLYKLEHVNIYWTTLLELFLIPHAIILGILQISFDISRMFGFGMLLYGMIGPLYAFRLN